MTDVVFTVIRSLNDLASATWHTGDNDSYKNTQDRLQAYGGGIRLIGRQDKYGRVQLTYAASSNQDWTRINTLYLTLARYFEGKLEEALAGSKLNKFFDRIDNADAAYAAQQLIGLQCGIKVTKEPFSELHSAVQYVQCGLRALDIPCGDWTFTPMFNSFEVQAPS